MHFHKLASSSGGNMTEVQKASTAQHIKISKLVCVAAQQLTTLDFFRHRKKRKIP